jgi:hypothetical protein
MSRSEIMFPSLKIRLSYLRFLVTKWQYIAVFVTKNIGIIKWKYASETNLQGKPSFKENLK